MDRATALQVAGGGSRTLTLPHTEIAAWCLFYVLAFTATQLLSHGPGDLVNDTLEAAMWGQHPALGYSKHPPFWAWIAHGWFKVFPFEDWSAYLLAAVNAAVGLVCSWRVAARFLSAERAMGAVLGLMLSATYVCFAQRFNANTVLVSLWPATLLAALRGMERNRLIDGVLAGLLAAACLLSKYYSLLFLVSMFASAGVFARSAKVYTSRAAITCYSVTALCIVPHLIWLWQNDFLPLHYAWIAGHRAWIASFRESGLFILAAAGFVGTGTVLYLAVARFPLWRLPSVLASGFTGKRKAFAILIFGIEASTIACGLIFSSAVRPVYAIPMAFLVPIWIAMADVPFNAQSLKRMRVAVLAVFLGCLALAPVMGLAFTRLNVRLAVQPRDELADFITTEWHHRFDRPLRIVAGDEDYAISAPFYSSDHPDYLIGFDWRVLADFGMHLSHGPADFDYRLSPWLNPDAVRREGMVIVCSQEWNGISTDCDWEASLWLGPAGIRIDRSLAAEGMDEPCPPFLFHIYFLPPS
jgi:hypothetical protein